LNCLTCRRLLLISPRAQTAEQRTHLAECKACKRLMADLADLDWQIEEAALVPVPEAIVHRVLLTPRARPPWKYAAAAAVLLAALGSGWFVSQAFDATSLAKPAEAVGPSHPAVAAISLVVDDRAGLAREGDTAEMDQQLKQLGLTLDSRDVQAHYAGKCQLPGIECDLIVLEGADGRANVVLVSDYPIAGQVLVADRRMIALVNPAKSGGYIVVADSPKVAKRMQKLFRRG